MLSFPPATSQECLILTSKIFRIIEPNRFFLQKFICIQKAQARADSMLFEPFVRMKKGEFIESGLNANRISEKIY